MVLTLERAGLIRRQPGVARSIQVLVNPEVLPPLRPNHDQPVNILCAEVLVAQIVPSPYVPPSPWKDDPPALRCCPRILPWPFDANCRPAQVACWLNSGTSRSPRVSRQRADELVSAVHIPRRLEFATSTPSAPRQLSGRAYGFPRSSPARTPDVSPARGTPRSPAAQSRGKHPSMSC
jgi:hypothetical protein